MLRRVLASVVVALTLIGCNEAGSLEDGLAAVQRGDFETANRLLLPLAEQGDAEAQFNLGLMYDSGRGVPQDGAEALKWLRLAADQGYADAQNSLGTKWATGQRVARNMVPAYMWFTLAAAQGNESAIENRDKAVGLMTLEQIATAQRLAREWKPKPDAE